MDFKKLFNKGNGEPGANLFKYVLLDTFIFVVVFGLADFALSACGYKFRQIIYYVAYTMIIIGFVVGVFQLLLKIKRRSLRSLMLVLVAVACLPGVYLVVLFFIFSYKVEHVVMRDDGKYVAYVSGFLDTTVDYFYYENAIVCGSTKRITEYWGDGAFDPLLNPGEHGEPERTIYYSADGRIIRDENNTGAAETPEAP